MTKAQLVQELIQRVSTLSQQQAKAIVHTLFSSMTQALARGEKIEIRDFGSFKVRNYQPYQGRNPQTGTKVDVAPKKLPHFKVGKELKDRVDQQNLEKEES